MISRTAESKVVKLPDSGEGKVIAGLAVDKNNNVYVVRWLTTRTENSDVECYCYVLNVLDEKFNVKHDFRLDFLEDASLGYVAVEIAINRNNNIIMMKGGDSNVCDNVGQLKHKFESHDIDIGVIMLGISNKDEIMIPSCDGTAVDFYSEDGNLKSTRRSRRPWSGILLCHSQNNCLNLCQ